MAKQFLQISAITEVSNGCKCIYFTAHKGFDYKPGQYITLLLQINGREVRRPYSLSSFQATDPLPFITVKLIENGEASRFLHEQASIGDTYEILPPNGRFTLPDTLPKHLFFLAAGSGISPILGLIKQALFTTEVNITLVYSNRSKEESLFYEELNSFAQTFKNRLTIHWLFSNNKNLSKARLNRFLLEDLVKQELRDITNDVLFYFCGPFAYMEMIEITLLTKGFQLEQ
ncbi:MAG: phenylacetic acid degradation protein, partial [Bacteroidetes bacterium]